MKKLFFAFIATAMIMVGCSDDGGNGTSQITLTDPTEAIQDAFADEESTSGFTFVATTPWEAIVEAASSVRATSAGTPAGDTRWLKLLVNGSEKYNGGAGNISMEIELLPNFTGATRSATVTIKAGKNSITITVKQEAETVTGAKPEDPNPVTGVTIDESAVEMEIGDTLQLVAAIAPANATIKEIVWTTSNAKVASVNEKTGLVIALSKGEATIEAYSYADKTKSGSCTVTVTETEDPGDPGTGDPGTGDPGTDPDPEPLFGGTISYSEGGNHIRVDSASYTAYNGVYVVRFYGGGQELSDAIYLEIYGAMNSSGAMNYNQIPTGTYPYSKDEDPNTFYFQKGSIGNYFYYCLGGSLEVERIDAGGNFIKDYYMLNLNAATSANGFQPVNGKLSVQYNGYINIIKE